MSHPLLDITPPIPGDLVVHVGTQPGNGMIRVQKDIMMTLSPVFRAMLGARYAEGQRKLDEEGPTRALHLETQELKTPQIFGVAIIADNFRCARQALQGLLSPVRLAFGSEYSIASGILRVLGMNVMDAIYLALLGEDEDLLYRTTKYAISQMSKDNPHLFLDERLFEIAWIGISTIIFETRQTHLGRLTSQIKKPIRKG